MILMNRRIAGFFIISIIDVLEGNYSGAIY